MTKTTFAERFTNLEKSLSAVAGAPVSVTIRGGHKFTWSIDEMNESAGAKLAAFARKAEYARVSVEHDAECGTFVYVDVA